jgi:hypothetical protein
VIRYIKREDIDDVKWDGCIDKAFNGNLYGHAWFLDIVADKWDALVENDYERVFPLVFRRKFGISYVYQPFFTQQLGLYSISQLDNEEVACFIKAIPSRFRRVETNLNSYNNRKSEDYKFIPQLNHELDLNLDYEKIRKGYSENLTRNLKKAGKAGLKVEGNTKPEEIIGLFRANRGKEISHLKEKNYLSLKRVTYAAMHRGQATIHGVYNAQDQLVAGAFFLRSNNRDIFLFSGLSEEGRNSGAMPFLIDQYIKTHAGQPLTFDFDGSNNPDLARFYKSFGSKECWYFRLELNRMPYLLKISSRLYCALKS